MFWAFSPCLTICLSEEVNLICGTTDMELMVLNQTSMGTIIATSTMYMATLAIAGVLEQVCFSLTYVHTYTISIRKHCDSVKSETYLQQKTVNLILMQIFYVQCACCRELVRR